MLPANLSNYADNELLRFIEDRSNPLIEELCRRLEGIDYQCQLKDLEQERDDAVDSLERHEGDIEEKDDKIAELEEKIEELKDLLAENEIAVPA